MEGYVNPVMAVQIVPAQNSVMHVHIKKDVVSTVKRY